MDNSVFPLWSTAGVDDTNGGCFDGLAGNPPTNVATFKRLRTIARQLYYFSTLKCLKPRTEPQFLYNCADFLKTYFEQSDGSFINKTSIEGEVLDSEIITYDQAFVLLAHARAYEATNDRELKATAYSSYEYIETHLRHKQIGYRESLNDNGPRTQNTHMHLYEAFMYAAHIFSDAKFERSAREIEELFRHNFLDEKFLVIEFLNETLLPLDEELSDYREPGHSFEWVWLLSKFSAERFSYEIPQILRQARSAIWDARNNMPRGQILASSGKVTEQTTRIWTVAEWLRTELALNENQEQINQAFLSLRRFIATANEGLWHEQWSNITNDFVVGPVPTTSLYHLINLYEAVMK